MPTLFDAHPTSSATISPCGIYRYTLERSWHNDGRIVNFIMLNPSTADASEDDPTIRRCVGFARSWGYGGLVVTNLYAFRATDPRELPMARDPIGPDNDRHIADQAKRSDLVLCAWGNHGERHQRGVIVRSMIRVLDIAPYFLKLTAKGQPSHPLYLKADLWPRAWETNRAD